MTFPKKAKLLFTASLVVTGLSLGTAISPVLAQDSSEPQVSMVTLKAVKGPGGGTAVITPKGMVAPLPGAGVSGDTAQIYIGSSGGFWYTDKNGQNVDLTEAVHRFQAKMGNMQPAQVPQYAPQPYYQQAPQQENQVQSQSSGNSGGSSAMGTAAAAGLGAMTGAAVTGLINRSYYDAPYGTPMYYGAGGPYYYNNGERMTVNDLSPNQKAFAYNQYASNQQEQAQRQAAAQQRYDTRQSNMQTAYSQHQSNIQQQQNWYQNQLKENPQRKESWQNQRNTGNNPFVAQHYQDKPTGRFNASDARASSFKERNQGRERSTTGGLRDRMGGARSSGGASGRFGGGLRRGGR